MAGHQPAVHTALALETTTDKKGFGAARQAGGAQLGDCMGYAEIPGHARTEATRGICAFPGLERAPCSVEVVRRLALQFGAGTCALLVRRRSLHLNLGRLPSDEPSRGTER